MWENDLNFSMWHDFLSGILFWKWLKKVLKNDFRKRVRTLPPVFEMRFMCSSVWPEHRCLFNLKPDYFYFNQICNQTFILQFVWSSSIFLIMHPVHMHSVSLTRLIKLSCSLVWGSAVVCRGTVDVSAPRRFTPSQIFSHPPISFCKLKTHLSSRNMSHSLLLIYTILIKSPSRLPSSYSCTWYCPHSNCTS